MRGVPPPAGGMDLKSLLEWWNLLFIIPLGLALLYLGLYVATGITFGHADADVDADSDVDADADADAPAQLSSIAHHDLDTDADSGSDADTDADSDTPSAHDGPDADQDHDFSSATPGGISIMDALSWLGAGRLPLSLLFMLFAMIWGIVGFNVNRLLLRWSWPTWLIPLVSIPLALLLASLLTRWIARLVARFLPMADNQAQRTDALVGTSGIAISPIDATFGLVQVRSAHGDVFQLPCRVPGDRPAIAKDQKVLLVDYNKEDRFFYVIPDELGQAKLEA